ncbi:MAG TPA: hypothetical protein DHV08_01710 [Rhodocyclaceae bacterium]|nr:MAG: hypothetical protein AUK49_07750 [Betaproteobacteria bacterium CG2_30_68_42]PIX75168.1 MAG: hypothetical protein COZ38_07040 [Rhodocyclales bacterium CG_4_10_14_3_um_filter_68_10]PJA58201.1 MAG: hypothetical protein CO164_03735 [Rhodocyclales bacterium CG_4_9_14_3_um_filter_68_10]HCX32377.1 hypothetical protein [Rhodocyclaceae bacterium]
MIDDWTTFLLTGASFLPAFIAATNPEALALAILAFVVLLIAGIFASLLDDSSPARTGLGARDEQDRDRER